LYAAEGEGLNPLAANSFMNYKRCLLGGKVSIRDVYAIIARHLPPDDPAYLESMSAAELEEMAARDINWGPRPRQFDDMSLEEALHIMKKGGAAESVASSRSPAISTPEVSL
jgi:hypothetical protein